ncbi:caspase family protein [Bosea vestrisii]|uniref:caspase family protein n=1 Tax=Bosea vestrisii TaxID=151416 RepID=UPI0024E03136|nr:caspase family protein [Bosea vestrisii]WID98962.1 caspase family protein [Bosea vestrisii]
MILIARLCGLIMLMLTGLAMAAPASERRVALVIGNSSYRNAPVLPNTVNDARDMAAALRKVGFEVIDGLDLDKRGMDAALTRFARLAQDADSVMFYFAGHGFQFNGENYLVPVEAKIEDEAGVQYETTRLNDVVTALNFAKGVKIMVLDACRNNPFVNQLAKRQATRGFSVGSGLAPVARAQGMVIAYATQANDVAADGTGRNSPFTAALVHEIDQPGLEVAALFRRVQKSVYDATAGRQTPELSLSLLGDFYLNLAETDASVWQRIRSADEPDVLRDFMQRYPTSSLSIDARTRLDLIERRSGAATERDRLVREFAERERALLERLEQAEQGRKQAATDLARQEPGEPVRPPAATNDTTQVKPVPSPPKQAARDPAERSRLADELARREKELAALEVEKRRLAEERRNVEQAMAARLGTLTPSPPDRSTQPQAAPASAPRPVERRVDTPAATMQTKTQCSELLLRAQLGELTPAAREQLQQCR